MNTRVQLIKYMLQDIRKVTLKGVSGLTKEQLFSEPVKGEFPIGAYLMHLGEAELGWLKDLTGKEQPEEIKKRVYYSAWFDVPDDMFAPPTSPLDSEKYVIAITDVRKILLDYIDTLTDEDLKTTIKRKRLSGEVIDLTKEWILYHLIEHEAHTRGQMFLLIRMAGFKKKGDNN